ncbi:hypothetical protein NP233_g12759 [Leucocoprinus birnbaumii]|uniref:Lysine decarboxylase-like protein n=1 Tax=Leucocoprinus birnbaumii TaxID=56174 RepID=A0AAD5VE17_9AGAR|nr:hypothetical protein NP233_g12759 [Leucocoprinus birnbaumii]
MLYSTGSGSTQRWAKELLASTAPTVHFSARKIETSDPQELTENYVVEELGLKGSDTEAFGGNGGAPSRANDAPKPSIMASSVNGFNDSVKGAVAVYCGSSMGRQDAYVAAAKSVGKAIALQKRRLVYGGGSKGIMGVVSGAVLENGGKVTGVVPHAMVVSGGEKSKLEEEESKGVDLEEEERKKVETIVVQSMHERKVEMAKRVDGFIGLPGGFGTFEEVLEVTTWTQLGIHDKPVVLCNVLGFWDPLRQLIRHSIKEGFIRNTSEGLVIFVDGPANADEHIDFDWGSATLAAIDQWSLGHNSPLFDWAQKMNGATDKKEGKWIAT